MNNPMQMIQEFQRFSANFQGNPKAEVEKLLATGRLSQKQLNELQRQASELQKLLANMK